MGRSGASTGACATFPGRVSPERTTARLQAAVAALSIRDYGSVTARFGVATHRKGEASREMVKRADVAMYAAKQGGRDRVELSAG
jgi:PleD family two-component response regulator